MEGVAGDIPLEAKQFLPSARFGRGARAAASQRPLRFRSGCAL
jgi:hypothetical protein